MSSHPTIGIVGSGIVGRLVAIRLAMDGCKVEIFEKLSAEDETSSSYVAAGMLAPYSELEHAPPGILAWGLHSIGLWRHIARDLNEQKSLETRGTIIASHAADEPEMRRLRDLWQRAGVSSCFEIIAAEQMAMLERGLAGKFSSAYFVSGEGHVHTPQVMRALASRLEALGCPIQFCAKVDEVNSGRIIIGNHSRDYDWVIDCRGFDAHKDIGTLRGVRGELFLVHAPSVELSRPVRIMHPRYPLYLVPRGGGQYVVGATIVESESPEPPTVRSALELFSALYAVNSAFGEARIIESRAQVRPAFADNRPKIHVMDRLLRVNGLYRHGFLLGPLLAKSVAEFVVHQKQSVELAAIWHSYDEE
jgi:glycine oxidase